MSSHPAGGDRRRFVDGPVRRSTVPPPVLQTVAISPTTPPAAEPATPAPRRRGWFGPRQQRRVVGRRRRRPWLRWGIITVVALVVLGGGYVVAQGLIAAHRILGNGGSAPALSGNTSPNQLKGEGDGRINILVLGIGGEGHDGPNLSDTMMVISIDPKNKTVAMMSIPRDLYVKIPGYGYGKINSANSDGGPALAEKVVSTILDEPIHYYAVVDFAGFKQAVDAVGGVTIKVPQALSDPQYPCDTGSKYCPYYQPAGTIHMSGTTALKYARCRHGDCGSDTGRAQRQQQVMVALRQQALNASTLTNPIKIGNLLNALGNHVKTDLSLKDIQKLAVIAKDIDTSKIANVVPEYTGPDAILTTMQNGAGDVLVPAAGEFNYTALQNLAHSIFADPYITGENAVIQVQNGSGVDGLGGQVVTDLKASHYNVMSAITAPQLYRQTYIYDYSNGTKPYTINYLQQRFGVKAQKGTLSTTSQSSTSTAGTSTSSKPPQIVVILGSDYAATLKGGNSNTSP